MSSQGLQPISIHQALGALTFLSDRTPTTTPDDASDAFARLAYYRDGGVFVGHWAGRSEWERHPVGDEIVMVVEGETTFSLLTEDGEHACGLRAGELVVVPQGAWHRFETPNWVKVLSVTPEPTDHRTDRPV